MPASSRSQPKRPRAAPPTLVASLSCAASPSLARSSTNGPSSSLDSWDPLPHSPASSLHSRAPRGAAATRSPSALSLVSTAASSSSARGGGSPFRPRTRTTSLALEPTTALAPSLSPPSAHDDDDDDGERSSASSDSQTPSKASSSSSLDGLAARLHGARAGKAKTRTARGEAELPRATSSRASSRKGKARLVEEPPRTTPQSSIVSASPTHAKSGGRAESPRVPADSASYDLPRQASAASEEPLPSASPTHSTAFQRPPPPSASVADPEEEDDPGGDDDDDDAPRARAEDDDDASSLVSVSHSSLHPDPRSLLRAQLARSPSSQRQRAEEKPPLPRATSASPRNEAQPVQKLSVGPESFAPRRYFILSTAGKLVYTSDEDEEEATGLVGVMQAIVSIFADEGDRLRSIDAGTTRISFLLKPPLYLVAVSSLGEPESVLRVHLDYLYLQVLSVVTHAQLEAIFARRSNFDLRRMLEGTEPFFASLTSTLQTSLPILLSSIEVYRLSPSVRDELSRALDPGKDTVRALDLLYVLLVCRGRLVTLLRPKRHSIHPTDLHLLLSTVFAPRGARPSPLTEPGSETWLPVCLPRFNSRGFLHAYVSFLEPTATPTGAAIATAAAGTPAVGETGLILLSSQRDAFPGVRLAASSIRSRLASSSSEALHALEMAAPRQAYSLAEVAVPGLRHFVYKERGLVQVTGARWEGEYAEEEGKGQEGGGGEGEKARLRLTTLYQHLHDALHPRPAAAGTAARPPAQVQFLRTEHEAVLGWVTPQFELYLATAPRLPHSAVVSAARAVSRWVKKEERELFLHGAGTF